MSRVAIMQPYFLPYLGYFSLIKSTDRFILFDEVKFIRHGWIDRNRILKQGGGWLYIRPNLKAHHHDTLIKELRVEDDSDWKRKILAQIVPYKSVAPYYRDVRNLLESSFERNQESLVSLNKSLIEHVLHYLGIRKSIEVLSEMDLKYDVPGAPDEWALEICKSLGNVDEYWNPPGGASFFNAEKYESAGLKLRFHNVVLQEYNQRQAAFEPGLSIIDAMMFLSPSEVSQSLDEFVLS